MPSRERALSQIDVELAQVRLSLARTRNPEARKALWAHIDRLLDERLEHADYSGKHARSE